MAKRFTDTEKYKKPFFRGLPGAYKLLWDYLYHTCDHAGIWIVDFEIAQIYLGSDTQVNKEKALEYFNQDETRIMEIDAGKKWFIFPFIEFQYGELNPNNNLHKSVIRILRTHGLVNDDFSLAEPIFFENNEKVIEPLSSPSRGAQYKDKDKEKDKDKDKEKEKERKGGMGGKQNWDHASEILLHLNDLAGSNFDPTLVNKKFIVERLEAGKTVEQLKEIVELKAYQAQLMNKGKPVFDPRYLRPSTLFGEVNCENYLNEIKEIKNGKITAIPWKKNGNNTKSRLEQIAQQLEQELG